MGHRNKRKKKYKKIKVEFNIPHADINREKNRLRLEQIIEDVTEIEIKKGLSIKTKIIIR